MSEPTTAGVDQAPDVAVLVPSTSAFDFLEGNFARSQRSRLAGLLMVGGSLVLAAGVTLVGLLAHAGLSVQEQALEQVTGELASVTATLGQLDAAEGIPADRIRSHISDRQSAIASAVDQELDTVRLIEDLTGSTPSGVSITEVKFTTGEDAGGTSVEVKATAESFPLIEQWSTRLGQVVGLDPVELSWSGGGSSVQVTAVAPLNMQAFTARAAAGVGDRRPPVGEQDRPGDIAGRPGPPQVGVPEGPESALTEPEGDL